MRFIYKVPRGLDMGEINIGVQDAYQAGLDVSKVSVTQAKTESRT